jgi:hypothetical protein
MPACKRLKIVDGKLAGWAPVSATPDYKTVFPHNHPIFSETDVELRDKYGNLRYKVDGEHFVLDEVQPTAEQVEAAKTDKERITELEQRLASVESKVTK